MINKLEKIGVSVKGIYGVYPRKLRSDFIMTSPSFNNDFLIETGFPDRAKLIVSLDDKTDIGVLLYHIQALHRRKADCVLVDKSNPHMDDLVFLKESGNIVDIGLRKPGSLNELREFNEKYGIGFITLSLHPLHFDINIIKYCFDFY